MFSATVRCPSTGLRMSGLGGWFDGFTTILRLAQDERTGGSGIGLGRDFRPLAPLGVTEGGRGGGSEGFIPPSAGGSTGSPRSFDGLGTSGGCFMRPSVRPSTGFRMNGLEAGAWLGGLATILRLAQDERTGCKKVWGACRAGRGERGREVGGRLRALGKGGVV